MPFGGGVPASGGGVPASGGGMFAFGGVLASGGGVWTWVLHILVQDGINTNMAATASLRQAVSDTPLGPRVRYFVVAMTCAAHTANLVTGSVVQGVAAKIGDVLKTNFVAYAIAAELPRTHALPRRGTAAESRKKKQCGAT